MGKKDTITKDYMSDNATFADAFNFLIYGGKQVIKPEQLKELDTTAIALPYGEGERPVPIQKYRDLLKAMTDGNIAYVLLGIENQSEIHYAMPPKNMLYDAAEYVSQVEDTAKSHHSGKEKSETGAEYLSGFYRTDKLLPVITLTVYFGAEKWNAPKSLYEMFGNIEPEILKFVSDYRVNLISPADIADEDFSKFHTELSLALKYIKYSKDKKRLRRIMQEDTAFKNVSRRTADMVNIVTNSNLHYADGEERVDMCEAIEGIRNDGIEIGIEKGIEIGVEKGVLKTLFGLVKDGLLSLAVAAERANMTIEEFKEKTAELND